MKLELELFKHNNPIDSAVGPLTEFEAINRLEKQVQRYLVECFGTTGDNILNFRWSLFTDHSNYYIRVDYTLNGRSRPLKIEVPYWQLTNRDSLLNVVLEALIEDLASLMVSQFMRDKHDSLDVGKVRLEALAKEGCGK